MDMILYSLLKSQIQSFGSQISGKQNTLTAGANIQLFNSELSTLDAQIVIVDCSELQSYTISDSKMYYLTNITTGENESFALSVYNTASDKSERHFFVEIGTTAPTISIPASWGTINFDTNKIVEISVLDGKAVSKEWDNEQTQANE